MNDISDIKLMIMALNITVFGGILILLGIAISLSSMNKRVKKIEENLNKSVPLDDNCQEGDDK
jgi:hypothetical protein